MFFISLISFGTASGMFLRHFTCNLLNAQFSLSTLQYVFCIRRRGSAASEKLCGCQEKFFFYEEHEKFKSFVGEVRRVISQTTKLNSDWILNSSLIFHLPRRVRH